jgi:rod shape-determining protein MreC
VAVLGSTPRRPQTAPYSSRTGSASRRRLVAGLLVVLSLALITVYFRESPSGRLHEFQALGAAALWPFEVAAERVARPFRDAYGYLDALVGAKSENARLRAELRRLRQQAIQNRTALQEAANLRALLRYRAPPSFPADYRPVTAAVLAQPGGRFDQQIIISAGSDAGIRVDDPVVTPEGLVGKVTRAIGKSAQVTLLVDEQSAVSAQTRGRARGLVRAGPGGALVLERVRKEDEVRRGDEVVTAGSRQGELGSLYPRGIPIGEVTSVGQTDVDLFKRVQIRPYVDFSSLDAVVVLVSKKPVPRLGD